MELFNNPVTIIAGILALFFISMGFSRRLALRRSDPNRLKPDQKPYQVSDPYAQPEKDTPAEDSSHDFFSGQTEAEEVLIPASVPPAKRYFKQVGAENDQRTGSDAAAIEYEWE